MGARGPEGTDRALVARVKGALESGIPAKVVSRLSGLPLGTVRAIQKGNRQDSVKADPAVSEALQRAMLGG